MFPLAQAGVTSWQHFLARHVTYDGALKLNQESFMVLERCAVCKNVYYPIVSACPNNHGNCPNCWRERCVVCDTPMDPIRARSRRRIDHDVFLACWYQDQGCQVMVEGAPGAHEIICPYGVKKCTFENCNIQLLHKRVFFAHCKYRHGLPLGNVAEIICEHVYFMHKKSYDVFLFVIAEDRRHQGSYKFMVLFMGDKIMYEYKYLFKMTIYPLSAQRQEITKGGFCVSFKNNISVLNEANVGNSVEISFGEAQHYFNKIYKRYSVKLDVLPANERYQFR